MNNACNVSFLNKLCWQKMNKALEDVLLDEYNQFDYIHTPDPPHTPLIALLLIGPSSEASVVESKDRKANAHLILKLMCDSVVLRPHLRDLLSAKYACVWLSQ